MGCHSAARGRHLCFDRLLDPSFLAPVRFGHIVHFSDRASFRSFPGAVGDWASPSKDVLSDGAENGWGPGPDRRVLADGRLFRGDRCLVHWRSGRELPGSRCIAAFPYCVLCYRASGRHIDTKLSLCYRSKRLYLGAASGCRFAPAVDRRLAIRGISFEFSFLIIDR